MQLSAIVQFFLELGLLLFSSEKQTRQAHSLPPPSAQFQPPLCAQPPCQLWQEPVECCEAQAPPLVRQLWWQGTRYFPGNGGPAIQQPRGRFTCLQENGKWRCVWPPNQSLLLPWAQRWRKSRAWAPVSGSGLASASDAVPQLSESGFSVCPFPLLHHHHHHLLFFSAPGETQVTQKATANGTPVPHCRPSAWTALQPQEGVQWATRW